MNILIVDDEAPVRMLLSQIIARQGFTYFEAANASDAEQVLEQEKIDLVLSDINMPGKSGLDFVRDASKTYPDMAVIMVTAVVDHVLADSLLKIGVYDYITKPIEKTRVLISLANVIHRMELKAATRTYQKDLESRVEERTESLHQTLGKLRGSLEGVVHAIARIVETRDPYTAGHQKRVASLARAIATHMNMADEQIEGVYMAGLIHDVGKIAVPSEILSKPTRLSDIEFSLIKTHAQAGYDILKDIEFPWPIADTVYQHHERHDGLGYPQGLCGDKILMEARILAVSDVVEAMASHRPYRAGLGIDVALSEIEKNMGTTYDPDVAQVCLNLFREHQYNLEAPQAF